MASVAGTQEPEYGPEAIQPVGKNAGDPAFTEAAKTDFKWTVMETTSVETQTFYLNTDSGHSGFVQVIYSNVAYDKRQLTRIDARANYSFLAEV